MIDLVLFAVVWIVCGVLAYGMGFAYTQREWPEQANKQYREHIALSAFFGLMGIIGLMATLISSGFGKHGLKFR